MILEYEAEQELPGICRCSSAQSHWVVSDQGARAERERKQVFQNDFRPSPR